jgi:hypothetical protein
LVVTISEPRKKSDGMVSLREYDGKLFLAGNEGHKRCLNTYRYYERQISGKLEVLNNKYFICLINTSAVTRIADGSL